VTAVDVQPDEVRQVLDDALHVLRLRRRRHGLSIARSTEDERMATLGELQAAEDRLLRDVDGALRRLVAEGAEAATSGSARAPGGFTSPVDTSSPADASAESDAGSASEPSFVEPDRMARVIGRCAVRDDVVLDVQTKAALVEFGRIDGVLYVVVSDTIAEGAAGA